jgi:hypothetical protein
MMTALVDIGVTIGVLALIILVLIVTGPGGAAGLWRRWRREVCRRNLDDQRQRRSP